MLSAGALHRTDPYTIANADEIASPALLLYRERIEANLQAMLQMVGGEAERLRPHVKTHKLPQIVARQVELGITKVKCATIAECEMAADAGATDILLAMQPVGPNVGRFLTLQAYCGQRKFSVLVDSLATVAALAEAARKQETTAEVLIDLDMGQHRTGCTPDAAAWELLRAIKGAPHLRFGGLHAYDGHLHQPASAERAAASQAAVEPVLRFQRYLQAQGVEVPRLIVGGTPTFPFHAQIPHAECSPGTCVLHDAGYGRMVDLPFVPAAALLTRVVSHPLPRRICLDLGHKAVASEMPHPRVVFPALPEAKAIAHSEEHLVLELPEGAPLPAIGTVLYGLPWHICPTVNLHSEVFVVEHRRVSESWPVVARARRLTI